MNSTEANYIYYFAIGSMMNPISLQGRNLKPLESFPGEILDYNLGFFGTMGMAAAYAEEGKSFHGVVHKMTIEDKEVLDDIERGYIKEIANVRCYDGNILQCQVYCKSESHTHFKENCPPTERYLEILIDGCIHYKVDESHIKYLKSLPFQPRTLPQDFKNISMFESLEGLPTWTSEDIAKGNGKDGNPLYFSINGKVREFHGDPAKFFLYHVILRAAGGSMELMMNKVLYEPKYGLHDSFKTITREHAAYLENLHVSNSCKFSYFSKYSYFYVIIIL